jgi:pyruvate,water dikinase
VTFVVTLAAAGAQAGVSVVGGKGASLGELARAGVAVPPCFVVTVEAFTAAMSTVDPSGAHRAEVEALAATDLAGIEAVAARFRALVTGAPLPAEVAAAIEAGYASLGSGLEQAAPAAGAPGAGAGAESGPDVAVRSSATVEDSAEASFAGLQDTYLGVSGAASVLDHVRRCWASLYNDESVAYRRRLGLPEAGVAMAVVVQRMVAPRAAGVMFTRSPVTGDRSVVAIEGTWGLGSALVSGDVTPDSWLISKITGEITGRRVSPKGKIHSYVPNGIAAASPPPPGSPAGSARPSGSPADKAPAARLSGTAPGHGPAGPGAGGSGVLGRVRVTDAPPDLRDKPCLTDDEIRALAAVARQVEAHYSVPQDIEWALLDGEGDAVARIVLLQSRPETVWAAREAKPAGTPKPRAADHVLALFGKPL